MYQELEKEFIKTTHYKRDRNFIIISSIIIIISYIFGSKLTTNQIEEQIILSSIILAISFIAFYMYTFMNLIIFKQAKLKNIFRIRHNINKYKTYIHTEDILNFGVILDQKKIFTNEKLIEMISYYRTKIPNKIVKSNDFIAFLSLIVSFVALFSTDFFIDNSINLEYALAFIFLSFLIFWIVVQIKSFINLTFGKDELYKRIEDILSEIYVQDLLTKKD